MLAPLYALTHAWGWLLRWQGALVPSGPHAMTAAVTGAAWWLVGDRARRGGIMLFAGDAGTGRLQQAAADRAIRRTAIAVRRAGWWAGPPRSTVGLALAMLAVPLLISWLTSSTGSLGTIAHFLGFGARPILVVAGCGGADRRGDGGGPV